MKMTLTALGGCGMRPAIAHAAVKLGTTLPSPPLAIF